MELSIIVPIYNVEDYLEQCLKSVYEIKGIIKEVILINDGSTDQSLAIIKRFQAKYPNETKVINKKNEGVSIARNMGIEIAQGDYISFIDSDDYIDHTLLIQLLNKAQEYDLEIAMGGSKSFGNITLWDREVSQEALDLPPSRGKKFTETVLNDSPSCSGTEYKLTISACDKIFKRKLIHVNNLIFEKERLHEDALFVNQAMFLANRVKLFDLTFYYVRLLRPGSSMTILPLKNYIDWLYIASKIAELFYQNNINIKVFNNRLIRRIWPGTKELLNTEKTQYITFSIIKPILIFKKFGLKQYIQICVLLIICIHNKIKSVK